VCRGAGSLGGRARAARNNEAMTSSLVPTTLMAYAPGGAYDSAAPV
jgi:hypothetical protein